MLFVVGCTPSIVGLESINEWGFTYPDLSEKNYCRGTGYITSKGNVSGRLNLAFTSSKNLTYVEFKDLIGRKTLFLVISNNTIDAWDIRNNRKYDQESLLLAFPFFELIKPNDLTNFLWGEIPKTFMESDNISKNDKIKNGQIQFSSHQTENGILINFVSFNIKDEDQKINLFVENRDFDMQYPHLIKKIPQSVIPVMESL